MFDPHSDLLTNTVFAAVDLETTGLDPSCDQIIEVAVQRFTLNAEAGHFSTLVNSDIPIPPEVSKLTGITSKDLANAPDFNEIKSQVSAALNGAVLVGHNINFDLKFLSKRGISPTGIIIDTLDLAYIIDRDSPDYRLQTLNERYQIDPGTKHRALSDCISTMNLFLLLLGKLTETSEPTLQRLQKLASASGWPLESLFTHCLKSPSKSTVNLRNEIPINTIDETITSISNSSKYQRDIEPIIDYGLIFGPDGPLTNNLGGYEFREEQVQMAEDVARALNESENLIVEAGTGTGKSLAYLIPALIHSLQNETRVVISTNTINLQEQLQNDDVPLSLRSLIDLGVGSADSAIVAVLKGRSNYLCRRRFEQHLGRTVIDREDALLLAKILLWIDHTNTGDKSELNLTRKAHNILWNKLSAEGAGYCEIPTGRCFLRNAREAAGNSNLVITNHSLLLADVATAGAALPTYELLIIDEAHHLEDQATRSLGFEINQPVVTDIFDRLTGQDSVTATSASLLRNTLSNENQLTRLNSIISTLSPTVNSVRTNFNTLFGLAAQYLENSRTSNVRGTMRITDHRGSRSWNSLTDISENIQLEISDIINSLNLLSTLSEPHLNINAVQSIQNDIGSLRTDLIELNEHLIEVITEPNPTAVYWIREGARQTYGIFCMAPVEVDEALKQNMFSQKDSVTLTSATLTTNGTFEHILRRLGFNPDASNTLPSPFDYRSTTLTLIPKDLPDPRDDRYLEELSVAIADAAVAASGKTLALFTSHAAIRHAYNRIRNLIEYADSDIEVLAQGISGDTQRLIERLRQNSRCILLGTASMWEGIDVRGEALQVVIITRLPFDVPTDPIYQARSEQYSNAFMDYAVPNAIMKFRQGFGRLIRSSSDRGIFIVMDNRLVRSRYGSKFIESLPSMTVKQCRRDELRGSIELWLNQT